MRVRSAIRTITVCTLGVAVLPLLAERHQLANDSIVAVFDDSGLVSVAEKASPASSLNTFHDTWSLTADDTVLDPHQSKPSISASAGQLVYRYTIKGYTIAVTYELHHSWQFVFKQIQILEAPHATYTVHAVTPLALTIEHEIADVRVPTSYTPQLGRTVAETHAALPGRDFGVFLRFSGAHHNGLMLLVQNPFLTIEHDTRSARIHYAPEMPWQQAWGPFQSDRACVGPYRLSGASLPREMLLEWKLTSAPEQPDGLDHAEIEAFRDCVRSFLITPTTTPVNVEVGWTLNDYQVDVATEAGKQQYHRIIDATAELGIHNLLYAPTNNSLAHRDDDTDDWHWEHTLWLSLGQKIRKGEWDSATSPLPPDIADMLAYAKSKQVGLLAYVYPSVPYVQTRPNQTSWLVSTPGNGRTGRYASMASRDLQDLLLRDLIAFKRRTGIAGYSFDYAFLDFPGTSSYAQWSGWRRVMEELRRAEPDIILDGRQSYQLYGPWSWLAGTYPHPTGQDEQPESFLPYPDLHFDRVSADRTRYVNFWYRNYQFAPAEIIPGYATHQTERSRNIPPDSETHGHPQKVEEVHTAFRLRDWDYLGFRYSFISSIGSGGWNNVVDMIPARDDEEFKHFSKADKTWIRTWLDWTVTHKDLLRRTQTILHQPQHGQLDGTAAVDGDHGFLFLFNPNYRALTDTLRLDASIGLTAGTRFALREVYPQKGRLWGKPGTGLWSFGDTVPLDLDGTSATVLEVLPAMDSNAHTVFNASSAGDQLPSWSQKGTTLALTQVAGEPGTTTELGVLMAHTANVRSVTVNGHPQTFTRTADYIAIPVHFAGQRFRQAQQISLHAAADGSLTGTFSVPGRIMEQLQQRAREWPIPWTAEDLKTTWLAPERLLLFIQAAEATDAMSVSATIDGAPITTNRAYSSIRVHSPSFVGIDADLSAIKPDVSHTLRMTLSGIDLAKLQGVFFDNVEPQLTTSLSETR